MSIVPKNVPGVATEPDNLIEILPDCSALPPVATNASFTAKYEFVVNTDDVPFNVIVSVTLL